MARVLCLRPADHRRTPWRNGRGVTEEMAIWPEGASFERGDFDARISRSRVVDAGAFSAFPGFDRVLVVTQGEGLLLSHDGAAPATVRRLAPHAFAGDAATSAELPWGPVADFNVFQRRGRCRATVETLVRPWRREVALGASDAFLHVVCGDLVADAGERPFAVKTGESLLLRDVVAADRLALVVSSGDCVALLVRIEPVPA